MDDQSIHGLLRNNFHLNPKISIVDVLSPIIEVVDQDDPIEGIMSEILLLSGSSFTQVNGNSDNEFYFPDMGLQILDNYYTADEIIDHEPNGIDIINEYVFDYKYDDEEKRFSVWEFTNRSLNISAIINYKINYALNDPSGNLSSTVTRRVEGEDTRAPVVKLYGLNPMYVDLEAILNEESRYSNPGAYTAEIYSWMGWSV